jgi:hypothetical protein
MFCFVLKMRVSTTDARGHSGSESSRYQHEVVDPHIVCVGGIEAKCACNFFERTSQSELAGRCGHDGTKST